MSNHLTEPKLRQIQELKMYEEPMFWCSQLFLPGWTPPSSPSPQEPWMNSSIMNTAILAHQARTTSQLEYCINDDLLVAFMNDNCKGQTNVDSFWASHKKQPCSLTIKYISIMARGHDQKFLEYDTRRYSILRNPLAFHSLYFYQTFSSYLSRSLYLSICWLVICIPALYLLSAFLSGASYHDLSISISLIWHPSSILNHMHQDLGHAISFFFSVFFIVGMGTERCGLLVRWAKKTQGRSRTQTWRGFLFYLCISRRSTFIYLMHVIWLYFVFVFLCFLVRWLYFGSFQVFLSCPIISFLISRSFLSPSFLLILFLHLARLLHLFSFWIIFFLLVSLVFLWVGCKVCWRQNIHIHAGNTRTRHRHGHGYICLWETCMGNRVTLEHMGVWSHKHTKLEV